MKVLAGSSSPFYGTAMAAFLRRRKDGSLGRRADYVPLFFCHIYECEQCGRRGSARVVQYRTQMHDFLAGKATLCMGCWNRLRVLMKQQMALNELTALQRKLLRTRHVA